MENIKLVAILDENKKVISILSVDLNPYTVEQEIDGVIEEVTITPNLETIFSQENMSQSYPNCTFIEYSEDKSTTNNTAVIDSFYDEDLNAFILPKPDETYILNTETFEWEPDPEVEYDLHGDGKMYKWIKNGWILVENGR